MTQPYTDKMFFCTLESRGAIPIQEPSNTQLSGPHNQEKEFNKQLQQGIYTVLAQMPSTDH
jgi:hypothetical protein